MVVFVKRYIEQQIYIKLSKNDAAITTSVDSLARCRSESLDLKSSDSASLSKSYAGDVLSRFEPGSV